MSGDLVLECVLAQYSSTLRPSGKKYRAYLCHMMESQGKPSPLLPNHSLETKG